MDEGVTSFKMFMAYPGVFLVNDATIFRAMSAAGQRGGLICMHAENGIVINEIIKRALEQGRTAPKYHALTRPTIAEAEGVHRAIAIAEMAESPVYIVHLSCADALNQVRQARDRGIPAFAETCPQYLFLSIDNYDEPGFNGAKYVMTPPLRDKSNQAELWKGLKMDDLQVISTDHCPFCMKEQKELGLGDFTKIPNGAPGVENRVPLIYNGGVVEPESICRVDLDCGREDVRIVSKEGHDCDRIGCRHRDLRSGKRTNAERENTAHELRLQCLRG
jgi:dihydropyrimidinase